MNVWRDRAVPRITDVALRSPEIGELREEACRGLRGRVLEIGFGSGLNIRFYPAEVTSVAAVEPSDVGWKLSEERRARTGVPVHRSGLDGQHLSEEDDSVDSALVTFSLCSIPDPALALSEVRRVLRPGGSLHFLEHGLAPDAGVARWQHRLDPVQKRVFAGCHLSRDVPGLVEAAGLEVAELRAEYQPGPRVMRPWVYGYLGRAVRVSGA
ncbi:MAG TPA: class I SAM-dependent methyltransferase [Nocardioides sp.]|nr:class I SAM-dependent methyltransferase [Nocardioides sp.]